MNLSNYFPLLVDLMLKSASLLGVVLLAARLARSASAANRSLVWLAAFGVLLALPFTSAPLSKATGRAEGTATVVVWELPARTTETSPAAPLVAATTELVAPGLRVTAERLFGRWREGLVALWLGGAGLLLARQLFGAGRLHVLKRRSEGVDDARIETCAARIVRDQGLARSPELRLSTVYPVAITWGTWRPVVLLPVGVRAWSDERIELVLRHELAHVARRDCLARLLSQAACALYWPNPLMWLAARRLRLAQEQACDDRVLAAGAEAPVYAEELLAAAKAWGGRASWDGAVSMAEVSTLERRIRGVLGSVRRERARRSAMLGAAVAACGVLAACSAVGVGERAPSLAEPVAAGAQTPLASPDATLEDRRKVVVEARFLELKGADAAAFDAKAFFGAALTPNTPADATVLGYLPDADALRYIQALSRRSGSDMLSAPKVTVFSGMRATLTVAQELSYPGNFEAVPVQVEAAKPTDHQTRNIGVEISVQPTVQTDGSVALEVETMIREFEGFIAGPPGAGEAGGAAKPGVAELFVPIFKERADSASLVLPPGQVAVLRSDGKKKVMPEDAPEWARQAMASAKTEANDMARPCLVFVSATLVKPASPPPAR